MKSLFTLASVIFFAEIICLVSQVNGLVFKELGMRHHPHQTHYVSKDGFVLEQSIVYKHSTNELIRYKLEADQLEVANEMVFGNLMKRDEVNWTDERDKLQALSTMMVLSYPKNVFYTGDEVDQARQAEWENLLVGYNSTGYNDTELFKGIRTDREDIDQIGLQVNVWTNPATDVVSIVFRGTYSTPDTIQNIQWFGDLYEYHWPSNSIDNWNRFKKQDYPGRDGMKGMYYLLLFDMVKASFINPWAQNISDFSGQPLEDVKKFGYYLLIKDVIAEVYNDYKNHTMVITGHSLGGTMAQLASLYLNKEHGVEIETVILGSLGSRCPIKDMGLDFDYTASYPFIKAYTMDYDLLQNLGYVTADQTCYLQTVEETDLVKGNCSQIVGLGIEILVQAGLGGSDGEHYYYCRRWTHNVLTYYHAFHDVNRMYSNGTTSLGCFKNTFESCPSYSRGAGYAFFIIFNIILVVGSLAGIIVAIYACVRLCYLKAKKKEGEIFFCGGCKCCECCSVSTI